MDGPGLNGTNSIVKNGSKDIRNGTMKKSKQQYDKEWYQKNKEKRGEKILEWRKNNKERYEESTKRRLNSEQGYMRNLWQATKDSGKHNSFKDFDDFFDHWLEQKKIYGMKCPGTGVEMTTKAFFNKN
mgnify:CR=1 FL=1